MITDKQQDKHQLKCLLEDIIEQFNKTYFTRDEKKINRLISDFYEFLKNL